MTDQTFDIAIVGAGMAGASVAYELAQHGQSVLLLEMEDQPGYHTTGRSAAMFAVGYGAAPVRALTRASADLYFNTPQQFSEVPLVGPAVGCLFVGRPDQAASLDRQQAELSEDVDGIVRLTPQQAREKVPVLDEGYLAGAVFEPHSACMYVSEIHTAYLRGAKKAGAHLVTKAALQSANYDGSEWSIETKAGRFRSSLLINAAGAWADPVAKACGVEPIGIQPLRRTAVTFDAPKGHDIKHWPLVIDVDEEFYIKVEGPQLLASPADEVPSEPMDAWADDMVVAECLDKVMRATHLQVERIGRSWAGLRSFAPDRCPVAGYEPGHDGFIWLAGQGGYGIQMAPALARATAALTLKQEVPQDIIAEGLDVSTILPDRLR